MNSLDDKPTFTEGGAIHDLNFASVFDKSYSGLVYFSFKLIDNKQEAEDIVQNAFVSYWNVKEDIGKEPNVVKSFLYTTVRNSCMDLLRHRLVIRKFRGQLEEDPIEENIIDNEIIRAEVLSQIFNAVELLPNGCKQVLKMSYFEGKRNQEIAEELGVSINTVKTQKQRALQLLRLKLTPPVFGVLVFLFLF